MQPSTKGWVLLLVLAATLALMVALVVWQISRARREAAAPRSPAAARRAMDRPEG